MSHAVLACCTAFVDPRLYMRDGLHCTYSSADAGELCGHQSGIAVLSSMCSRS